MLILSVGLITIALLANIWYYEYRVKRKGPREISLIGWRLK